MKKKLLATAILVSILSLAACSTFNLSSIKIPGLTGSAATEVVMTGELSKMSPVLMLSIGTLKLEGTNLAVTAAQAKDLLPLWKGVRSLYTATTTAPAEMQALYDQIKETMTAEQLAEIEKMSVTQDDLQALTRNLGGAGQFGGGQPGSDGQVQATRSSTRTFNNGSAGGNFSGGGDFGGGMPPDAAGGGAFVQGGGGTFGGGTTSGQTTTRTQVSSTRTTNTSATSSTAITMVTPLINLLTMRAAG